MGTNFYHRNNLCHCCGRFDERHIGKSFTMFQGYDDIRSWQDWKRELLAGGEVWDEYSAKWDTEGFIAAVERTIPAARRRQYDWVMREAHPLSRDRDWLDADGFSFTDQEFE